MQKCQIPSFLFCKLELTLIFQHFVEAIGPLVCLRAKICIQQRNHFWQGLSELFYAKMPNSHCLEFTLISRHFAKPIVASRLPVGKSAYKQKVIGLGHNNFAFMQTVKIPTFDFWPMAQRLRPLQPTGCIPQQKCII